MALLNGAKSLKKRGHIEDIAEAFAIGLKQQRERWIARGDAEQIVGSLAKLPERRAAADVLARQKERPTSSLAKSASEERSGTELMQDELHDFLRGDEKPIRIGRLFRIRET